jgi:acetylornithine deacetylase/succinyl-diaminopimelate desuccinylase-like protein
MKIQTDPIKLTKKLVSINSLTGNEYNIGRFIHQYLTEIGLPARYERTGKNQANVYVVGKGPLLINAHMDVVPLGGKKKWTKNPYGELSEYRVYGRGVSDTKGSIACLLSALARNPNKNVNLLFTVEEEISFKGIKKFLEVKNKKFRHVKNCLNLEPTDLRLVTSHKGNIYLTVTTRGKAAHSSIAYKGVNAILKMNKVIPKLTALAEEYKKGASDPILEYTTLSIGKIEGGSRHNIVPDEATIHIDIRHLPNKESKKIISRVRKIVKPAEVRIIHDFPPAKLKENSRLIKLMKGIVSKHGIEPETTSRNYLTESSLLLKNGINGVIFGAGDINQNHTIDENIKKEELIQCHEILSDLLKKV